LEGFPITLFDPQKVMLERISQFLNGAIKYMVGILTGAMAVLVFLQVLFRYLLKAPLDWSEEMSTFAFAWMALLGASIGLRNDEHPRLDIFLKCFPGKLQKTAQLVINLSILFMLLVLLIYGTKLMMAMRMQSTAALGYSVAFVYAVLPFSAAIMIVHVLAQTFELLRNLGERH
jgi:TRAP-type C4-dicarboxylate transport system permease small subunit